ncbi:MAG: protoporphyrinogen oxidase [Rhabdochlamydiaceae bacterium]
MKKTIAVLGGGIAGLTAAWLLSHEKQTEVLLIEKKKRLGGWIDTNIQKNFLYEKGAKTFERSRSEALLYLISKLGLSEHVIHSNSSASIRYVYNKNHLKKIPNLYLFIRIIPAIIKDLFVPYLEKEETISSFFKRRFSSYVLNELIDPLVKGIYAGSVDELSFEACFPLLKVWEKEEKSLIKAFLKKRTKKQRGLFSLDKGMSLLIEKLCEAPFKKHLDSPISHIEKKGERFIIHADQQSFEVDEIFSALPSYEMAKIFCHHNPLNSLFSSIQYMDLTSVYVGYQDINLFPKGFGYLVPSKEKEHLLGVVFDSHIFPQQAPLMSGATLMFSGIQEDLCYNKESLRILSKHLGIKKKPDFYQIDKKYKAIPQYTLGHQHKIAQIEEILHREYPKIHIVGSYTHGVSVNDCIKSVIELCRPRKGLSEFFNML